MSLHVPLTFVNCNMECGDIDREINGDKLQ